MHLNSTGRRIPCCVALGEVLRPKTDTQKKRDLTCAERESILRARDGDNSLIQYGILVSVMEADFLIGGPSFLCTL